MAIWRILGWGGGGVQPPAPPPPASYAYERGDSEYRAVCDNEMR